MQIISMIKLILPLKILILIKLIITVVQFVVSEATKPLLITLLT